MATPVLMVFLRGNTQQIYISGLTTCMCGVMKKICDVMVRGLPLRGLYLADSRAL